MQFIYGGPDIPDDLLQAHEEGRVVFFCGAGISYPAGLPGFKGLVDAIYKVTGTTKVAIEQEAYDRGRFDATLDLLERRLPGQRTAVRKALAQSLKPTLRRKGATETHTALLRLARSRKGDLRLVTTNFDGVFEVAAKRDGQQLSVYSAPMLPIPKNSRWNGLIYLHGSLPRKPDAAELNRLVVTSGDFGLAYLTERWAARFVSELFRNYSVCFVGYSINDPVLRYMMDALAADRMLGESIPQAWALGDCEPGQEKAKTIEWQTKGVTPILYKVPVGSHDHSALHQTLHVWGETYRDGVLGKEKMVISHALARPSASTQQDDFVGRVLWALSDPSGLPAKQFAEYNPAPSLDWLLDAFCDDRYRHPDLPRFGVPPLLKDDGNIKFSLIRRPTPYTRAPQMTLASGGFEVSQWDDVMSHLARWLLRHLNDPDLILWIVQRGGKLHERWSFLVECELNRLNHLIQTGKAAELDDIRTNSPNAIPGPVMQILWRLLLGGRIKSPWRQRDLYGWKARLEQHGITGTIRVELREALTPKVELSKPFRWGDERELSSEPSRVSQILNCELVLADDDLGSTLRELRDNEHWRAALPRLVDDFQLLLSDCLDLMRELGEADEHHDRSSWVLPSISPHWQNRRLHDWVTLIELLRDSWLAILSEDRARASIIAQEWFKLPYPTFKRLAFFAAAHNDCIFSEIWVNWLSADDSWWLWSPELTREVLRLLVLQGGNLRQAEHEQLEIAILMGPPRRMYREDLEPEQWDDLKDRSVWLRLAKLRASGTTLGAAALKRFEDLSRAHAEWELAPNERDEFSIWTSGTGDPDSEDLQEINIAPSSRRELALWLKQPVPDHEPFYNDTWRETCRKRLSISLTALCELARAGDWPETRWREALQTWSDEELVLRSWRYAAPLVQAMPDDTLVKLVHQVTWWLEAVSKSVNQYEGILLDLSRRVLEKYLDAASGMEPDGEAEDDPIGKAINHPVGHVTQALLNLWFKRKPNDGDRLPSDIEPFFTQLCDIEMSQFHHGRVLLGAQSIALFRVDRPWAEQRLLPIFNWATSPNEARSAWSGFLWSPRLYWPLLSTLKQHFLETAQHYAELGRQAKQFAAFLTYAALEPDQAFSRAEFGSAVALLPRDGLEASAEALTQALEAAGAQREEYWKNRILPFWQQVWPKSRELVTEGIADDLARLSIAAGSEFPAALTTIQDWLIPIIHPHYVMHRLHESGMCTQFPEDALRLLGVIIDDQPYVSEKLKECLVSIEQTRPALTEDPQYIRLNEYARRRGM